MKNVQRPTESADSRPSVLQAHHESGISKKSKRGRKSVLSTKARKRRDKDAERAEAIIERTALKLEKSKGQARNIQTRSKTWDVVNKHGALSQQPKFLPDEDSAAQSESEAQETDEEMGVATAAAPPTSAAQQTDGSDEEIL